MDETITYVGLDVHKVRSMEGAEESRIGNAVTTRLPGWGQPE